MCSDRYTNSNRVQAIPMLRSIALLQGAFYAVTGFWPIASIESFQTVTGPKRDLWLVKVVGGLIALIGVVLVSAASRRRVTPEMVILGAGSALTLATSDLVYFRRGVLGPIYVLDAVGELILSFGWLLTVARCARWSPDGPPADGTGLA